MARSPTVKVFLMKFSRQSSAATYPIICVTYKFYTGKSHEYEIKKSILSFDGVAPQGVRTLNSFPVFSDATCDRALHLVPQ
jgi:hypothetical protein